MTNCLLHTSAASASAFRRRYQRGHAQARRGLSALTIILSMSLIFALIALAVDVGLLVQRHQQLKTAGEAAALAAAIRLFDAPPGAIPGIHQLQARKAGVAFAAENSFSVHPLELNANLANAPKGDIVFGNVDAMDLGGPFAPWEPGKASWNNVSYESTPFSASHHQHNELSQPNAILVRTRHSQAGGGGPLFFFGQLAGVSSHDIFTESIAAVERRVYGYRPVGCANIPLLPILCRTKRWPPRNPHAHHGQENPFSTDVNADQGQDTSENLDLIELTLKIDDQSEDQDHGEDEAPEFKPGKPIKTRVISFLEGDEEAIFEQIASGLSPADLAYCDGEVCVGDQLNCLNTRGHGQNRLDGEKLIDALQSIIGQPRLLPLGCAKKQANGHAGRLEDFAACVVIHSQLHEGAITILIQPIVLNSSTALIDPQAKPNPWVGKVLLVR